MSGLTYSPAAVRAAAQEEGNQLAAKPETRKSRVSRGRGRLKKSDMKYKEIVLKKKKKTLNK